MDWLRKIVEFVVGMGRKRHLTFGRLLVLCGVGFLAAPELWVQLAVMLSERLADFYGAQSETRRITVPDFAGLFCLAAGVATFWYFERRESIVVEGDGGVSVSIPGGQATLSFVLSDLLATRRKPLDLEGFTQARLESHPREGNYEFQTLYDAIDGLVSMTNVAGEPTPSITLDEGNSKITVRANYAEDI